MTNKNLNEYAQSACKIVKTRVNQFYKTHTDIDKTDDEIKLIVAVAFTPEPDCTLR